MYFFTRFSKEGIVQKNSWVNNVNNPGGIKMVTGLTISTLNVVRVVKGKCGGLLAPIMPSLMIHLKRLKHH